MNPTTFATRAAVVTKYGVPVIPINPHEKKATLLKWQILATTNAAQIAKWDAENADYNCGAVGRKGEFWILDADRFVSLSEQIERETGHQLDSIDTLMVRSSEGKLHLYFKHDARSEALGNFSVTDASGEVFSVRADNAYVVAPGSIHPKTGLPYEVMQEPMFGDIPTADGWLMDWLEKAKRLNTSQKAKIAADDEAKIPEGGRDEFLFAEACRLRDAKVSQKAALAALVSINRDRCVPPMPDSILKIKIKSAYTREARVKPASATEQFVAAEPVEDFTKLLHPKLSDDALYGLAGNIVKRILPQTESHPAGLLIQILMYFGNIVGHNAYFQVESTRHYGNLFAVRVGESSKSRKGTGGDRINAVYEQVDPVWYRTRVRSGLSSNEGLIVAIGDEELSEDSRKHTTICDAVRDKRLLTYEGEFSQLLVVMQRPGNTISTNIRNAWDGKPLRTMTIKPRCATNHIVSILGDITSGEAKTKMTGNDSTNGFSNRFLWVHVERTKSLPFGGEEIDFGSCIEDIKKAIEFAEAQKRIFMDENARKVWSRAYERLSTAHDGLFGAVTSRGEAQVIRLALLYALLDCSDHIRSEHLHAALAFWQYCEDSARFIFDELTVEQQMIVEHLLQHGSQTKTDFLKGLFQRHRLAAEVVADLNALERRGMVSHCQNKKSVTVYFVQGRRDCPVLPENKKD